MGVFAVYIKKEASYFGEVRPFGNTYHYKTAPGQTFNDEAVAEAVALEERKVTQGSVTFKGWTTWGPTDGPPLGNVIREQGTLTGVGQGPVANAMYREVCALVVIEIARSPILNRRRWLRKFLRNPGVVGDSLSDQMLAGAAPLGPAFQTGMKAYGNAIKNISQGGTSVGLCTEAGDGIPLATPAEVRPFLFTRQIGD